MTYPAGFRFNRRLLCGNLNRREPLELGKYRPFVYRNREAYEKMMAEIPCSFCGYNGRSKIMARRVGKVTRTVPREIFSSEKAFKAAVRDSQMVCLNCLNEVAEPAYHTTAKAAIRVGVPVMTKALHERGARIKLSNTTPSMLVSKEALQAVVEDRIQELVSGDTSTSSSCPSEPQSLNAEGPQGDSAQ